MTQNGFSLKVVIPLLIIVTVAFFVAFGAVIGGLFWQYEQVDKVFEAQEADEPSEMPGVAPGDTPGDVPDEAQDNVAPPRFDG